MYINRTPARPCMRDMADLTARLRPVAEILKAVPMKQVRRRLREIVTEEPRFAEEAPLVIAHEENRRRRLANPLYINR
ncbi:hypothetical protein [Hymenobacter negativus]|uniref:Uncharacterized protein n=1 Tax=Hymenobacter negativus TaxID=2795026 RepID=A0ABS3QD80_9BACT|nr:hypothetical protein [Hymenobacter negativus]MBO2009206.1 hypothetical protein [Hymenobacter negativus]